MNNQESKKLFERDILNSFRIRYDDFPKGKIIESESPDFIIQKSKSNKIGVEITRLIDSDLNKEDLARTILAKEEKLKLYQKKWLNAYWLIIVINIDDVSINNNIYNQLNNCRIESNYQKVFLFDNMKDKIFMIGY